ncbi:hypothetical protein ACFC1D_21185 [Streptomyces vinaceus]|uniref:hypothetical protein n=1 Tax=Streptomyces vinaceus TaxID=1960 RepID=UPI0035D6586D
MQVTVAVFGEYGQVGPPEAKPSGDPVTVVAAVVQRPDDDPAARAVCGARHHR